MTTDPFDELLDHLASVHRGVDVAVHAGGISEGSRFLAGDSPIAGLAPGTGADPTALDRYLLRGLIGRGGMGRVFRAYDPVLRREVALKVVDAHRFSERYRREARAAAQLNHPNIVAVYDAGEVGDFAYLAMELVKGAPLDRAWASWPRQRRVDAVETLSAVVGYAHARGVVHRDIKPGNVMVQPDGTLKLMDLGLARVEGEPRLTVEGTVMGTPAYMAPEQVRGEPTGAQVDVYALGVTLFEALTGGVPFDGTNLHDVCERILKEEPVRPGSLQRGVPPELDWICLKAIEKAPPRRYAHGGELADDLRRWREGRPIRAGSAGRFRRFRRRVRRNPTAWTLGIGALGVSLAAIAMVLIQKRTFDRSHESARALARADRALLEWRMDRYPQAHSVLPARRRLEEAVSVLQAHAERRPDDHAIRGKLGWALLQLGRAREATACLERARDQAPDRGEYRWWLGLAFLERAEENPQGVIGATAPDVRADAETWRERAEAEIRAALASSNWEAEPWERALAQAYVHVREGRQAAAEEICRRVADANPKGGEEGWLVLAQMTADPSKGIEYLRHATRMAPSWASASYLAAIRYVNLAYDLQTASSADREEIDRLLADATREIARALTIDPEFVSGHVVRGVIHGNQAWHVLQGGGDPTKLYGAAVDCFTLAVERDPQRRDAWLGRGLARFNVAVYVGGDSPESLRQVVDVDFSRAIDLSPGAFDGWLWRGVALGYLGQALERAGEDPVETYRRAVEEDLVRAAALNPRSLKAHVHAGWIRLRWSEYLLQAREDPSEHLLRILDEHVPRAKEIDAASPDAWIIEGRALGLRGFRLADADEARASFERAEAALTRAIELDPRAAQGWKLRGLVRLKLGRRLAAAVDFEEARKRDPAFRSRCPPPPRDPPTDF